MTPSPTVPSGRRKTICFNPLPVSVKIQPINCSPQSPNLGNSIEKRSQPWPAWRLTTMIAEHLKALATSGEAVLRRATHSTWRLSAPSASILQSKPSINVSVRKGKRSRLRSPPACASSSPSSITFSRPGNPGERILFRASLDFQHNRSPKERGTERVDSDVYVHSFGNHR